MRKILIVMIAFILSFGFASCGKTEEIFSIEQETKDSYNSKINELVKKYRWNYDDKSISYEQEKVPNEDNPRFNDIVRATSKEGFDIEDYKGKTAILATMRLFHFNNDEAGKASFYFVNDEIVCGYYISGNTIYALSETNTFEDGEFSGKTENSGKTEQFSQKEIKRQFDGFDDYCPKTSIVGVIADEKAKFFKFNDGDFSLEKELDFSKEGLFPMDISFDDDGTVAILLGTKKKTDHEVIHSQEDIQEMKENGLTDADINGEEFLISNKIVFFDDKYNKKFNDCKLDVSSYGSLDYNNGEVFVSRGKGIDVFVNSNGDFSKSRQYQLKQWVEKIKSADIENDGVLEFIMTDNTNIFIYHLAEFPTLIWRTHLSLESIENRFYVGDINGDGSKEIYITDDYLKTSTKYVIEDYGFKSYSADYGTEYIVGDFDNNGNDDYIAIKSDSENDTLYTR